MLQGISMDHRCDRVVNDAVGVGFCRKYKEEEIWVRNTDTHIVQVLFAQLLVFHPVSDVCGPAD